MTLTHMSIAGQLRDHYADRPGLPAQVSLAWGRNRGYISQTLVKPPRSWALLERIVAELGCVLVVVPQGHVDQVSEVIATDSDRPYGLVTPSGLLRRLTQMITQDVLGQVYRELDMTPAEDTDTDEDTDADTDEDDEDEDASDVDADEPGRLVEPKLFPLDDEAKRRVATRRT